MFAAVYRFDVQPGQEERFRAEWRRVTEFTRAERGGLGSRLHRSATGEWIAYAQWPSRGPWAARNALSEAGQAALAAMRACCRGPVEVFGEWDVTDDLLSRVE